MRDTPIGLDAATAASPTQSLDLLSVHHAHAEFVWLSLQRMGVPASDVEDLMQEVFVVVHRRLHTFDHSARITTWLYGICLRVTAAHRRRAHRKHETMVADVPEDAARVNRTPEEAAAIAQDRRRLRAALDGMDVDKRAIFVMFELDELSCDDIAQMLSIPLGTVYSRLHAARKAFEQSLARIGARDASGLRGPTKGTP